VEKPRRGDLFIADQSCSSPSPPRGRGGPLFSGELLFEIFVRLKSLGENSYA
jgi:hypothetical protein